MLARLKQITHSKTDNSLSIALGISPQTLSSWKIRERIPYAICIDIADQHGISLDWLLVGDGPQFRPPHNVCASCANTPWEAELLNQIRTLPEVDQHAIAVAVQEKRRVLELERRLEALTASYPYPLHCP